MAETPESLNVSLTPELTRFITSPAASGRYQSASGVVRAALCLVIEQEGSSREPDRGRPHG